MQGQRTVLSPPWVSAGLPRGWDPPQHLGCATAPLPALVPAASASLLENCTGCVLCSEDNGCITCHHRLFLLIWRDGIRQYGTCVHTCPPGYFGVRGLEVNRCTSTSRASPGAPAPPSVPASPRWSPRGEPGAAGPWGSHPFPAQSCCPHPADLRRALGARWVPGLPAAGSLRAGPGAHPADGLCSPQSAGRPAARAASAETSA